MFYKIHFINIFKFVLFLFISVSAQFSLFLLQIWMIDLSFHGFLFRY